MHKKTPGTDSGTTHADNSVFPSSETGRVGRSVSKIEKENNRLLRRVQDLRDELDAANTLLVIEVQERKKAEERARRLKALMNHHPALIFLKDEQGKYVYVNESYEKQFFHSKEWHGKTDFDIWPRESAELFRANDLEVLKKGTVRQFLEDSTFRGKRHCWVCCKFPFSDAYGGRYVGGIGIEVTDRVRAEEALREREAELAEAQRVSKTGSWSFDILQNRLRWSDELYRIFEVEKTNTSLQPSFFLTHVHPDDRAQVLKLNGAIRKNGTSYELQYRIVTPRGTIKTVREISYASKDPSGNVIRLFGTTQDITEQKRIEQALRESERRFRGLVTASSDVIYRMSPDWGEMRQLHGADFIADTCSPSEKWMDTYIVREDQPRVYGAVKKAIETKSIFELAHRVVRVDGSIGWTFSRAIPLLAENGEIAEWFGTAKDITERKEIEERLRESEERLRIVTQAAKVGFYDADLKKGTVYWSPEMFAIMGLPADAVAPDVIPLFVHKDDADRVQEIFKKAFDPSSDGEVFSEHRIVRPDSSVHWVQFKGRSRFIELGKERHAIRVYGMVMDITDRKRMEEELKKSEEKARLLVKDAPSMIFEIDYRVPKFITVNDALCSLLGYTREEFLGMSPADILVDESKKKFEGRIKAALSGEKIADEVEYTAKTRDGRTLYGVLNISLTYENEKPVGAVIVAHDITERKRMELALRESEDLLRAVTENSPDAIYVKDLQSRWLMANPAVLQIVGKNAEEALGKNDEELFADPIIGRAIVQNDQRIMRTGTAEEIEELADTPKGRRTFLSIKAPRRDEKGNITGIVGISRDITERKRTEDRLEADVLALTVMHALSTKVLPARRIEVLLEEIMEAAIVIMRADKGTLQLFDGENLIMVAHFGHQKPFLTYVSSCDSTLSACETSIKAARRIVVEDVTKNPLFPGTELLEVLSNAGVRALQSTPLLNRNGALVGVLTTHWTEPHVPDEHDLWRLDLLARQAADLIEQKQSEVEIKNLNLELAKNVRDLAAANKEMEAFIYSVSHDLRAPLRAIAGFSDLLSLEQSSMLDHKGKDYLDRIVSGSKKMNRIIEELLNLSRISRKELHRKNLDITALAKAITSSLRETAPARAVSVIIQESLTAFADPGLIEIALSNLLNNAWKFTAKKDHARIEVGMSIEDGRNVYYIKDNGAGFDAAHATKLFMPFQRLHREDEFEGTGIGMAITERVIRRHGGRIWADGRKNEGACFYFTLQ